MEEWVWQMPWDISRSFFPWRLQYISLQSCRLHAGMGIERRIRAGCHMRKNVRQALLWLCIVLAMGFICMPGVWVVLNAFRPNVAILGNENPLNFSSYTLDNFRNILGLGGIQPLPVLA